MKPVRRCVMTPSDVFYAEKETIDLSESEGRIPAGIIMPYPPGIPIVALGERITAADIEKIGILERYGINIAGIENNKIAVVKENEA